MSNTFRNEMRQSMLEAIIKKNEIESGLRIHTIDPSKPFSFTTLINTCEVKITILPTCTIEFKYKGMKVGLYQASLLNKEQLFEKASARCMDAIYYYRLRKGMINDNKAFEGE